MTFISSTKLAKSLNDRSYVRLPSTIQRWPRPKAREILPGLFLSSVIAGTAFAIRQLPGMATFSSMILSMMIGNAFHRIVGTAAWAKQGVTSSLRWLPRIGIFPFGLQLNSSQVIEIGGGDLGIVAATVRASFAVTIWIGELLGVEPNLAQLIAAGTSICGASAVIAANTRDEDVAYAIACVTVFGSVAMFAHPIPADAKAWIVAVTTFLQAIALAAMRPETNIGRLTAKGFRPALLGGLAFLFIAGFCLTLIKLMEQHSMTLEQLRIFIAVAEKQHVTQAASQLNLTQSATSAAIAALERRYGIKLFDRVGRGIVLTQTGRDFLNEAREVVARAKAAAQVLDDLAGLKRGSLTLAASQTVANYWLPSRIQAFRKAHAGIDLQVTIANTEQVAQAVNRGNADLGFVEGEVDDPSLSIRKMEGDSLAVVVGASHPWVGKTRITPKLLTETCWILREPGSGTRSMFEAALKKFGIKLSDLDIRLELPSNEAVRAAVESGDCATAISDLVVVQSLAAGTLHRVQIDLPKRSFFALRHKERYASQAERALFASFRV